MKDLAQMKTTSFRSVLKRSGAMMVAALVSAPLMLASGCSQPQGVGGFVPGKRAADQTQTSGYDIGLAAYQTGQFAQAIDIWKRYSMAGDVRAKKVLGDVYSGADIEGVKVAAPRDVVGTNKIEALKWYTLAAFHDFGLYQRPTADEVNARILAEHRLPELRSQMKSSEVVVAEKQVADAFEAGTLFDVYRLGLMYQGGSGVAKNNVRALTLFKVASKQVPEAAGAYDALVKLMDKPEIDAALDAAIKWQPPLPVEHTGMTAQMKENERLKKELQELKAEDALKATGLLQVELIQRALKYLGFYYGEVNNKMGESTVDAIRRFQLSQISKKDPMLTDEQKDTVRTGVLSARQTVELFETAAKAEHPMSQYIYGLMFARGVGVSQDGTEAVNWLTKAAKADLAIANYALGVIYRDGTTGLNEVTPNKALAAQRFARACMLKLKEACDAGRALELERATIKD